MRVLPFVFLLFVGCAINRFPGDVDPGRAPIQCVNNPFQTKAVVFAEGKFNSTNLAGVRAGDIVYRIIEVRQVDGDNRVCFRWPWVSREGRILISDGKDIRVSVWFDPWK